MSFPSTIKAIVAPKHGDVDVIDIVELPFPKQQPNEILVKVKYVGVNFIDTYQRKGLYPAKSFPVRLGTESSGVLVGLPTDEKVLNDPEYKKRGFSDGVNVAVRYQGSMAEYVSVPWHQVQPIPPSIDLLTAAAALLQGLTALTMMCESHDVKKGETILVHTVAGGLGLIFAQIAHARGATVIGTTSSKEKAELAKKHGADHVILYTEEDTVQRVLEITNGEGVEAVFDGVGKDTFEGNFKVLKRKGTLVSVGNASGAVPPFPPLKLTEKNLKLLRPTLNNYVVTPEESYYYTTELFKLIENGTVKINVHKVYPFTAEGAKQTQIDITGRGTTGKLVIQVSE
ncbi:NAD-binding protein [Schizopora paradoxa]|uniref:Probable quinone oxidoreductase n=1 Tax=Schizopora paradoxa TaxID=27342 RepID=A0A0H2RWS1_9AGAM|nr:NAD-binding protein [Schizopora paradoxa]